MNNNEILALFQEFTFDNDDRKPPDERRKGQFHAGWQQAADGEEFTPATLSRLTWNNAGFRMGKKLGPQSADFVHEVFDVLANEFNGGTPPKGIPAGLTANHIRAAAKQIQSYGHGFGESTKYDVIVDDRRYPPKAIVGVAASILTGEEYGPNDFSGGFSATQANGVLESLDFEVVPKQQSTQPAELAGTQIRLLTWNPNKWPWPTRQADFQQCQTAGSFEINWSCGRSNVPVGTRVFLMRLGQSPKGLVGSGRVVRETYEDAHWNPQRADAGDTTSFVDVRFDYLSEVPLITEETLNGPPFDIMRWTPQNSGNHINAECRSSLESLWARLTGAGAAANADEIDASATYFEGAAKTVTVNRYERDPTARRRCIAEFGSICFVCEADFGQLYGEFADGYIHVHHKRPISEIGNEYSLNPVTDLCPLCPNCHAAIHLTDPLMSPEELRSLWQARTNQV